jgi:hypothetical protein
MRVLYPYFWKEIKSKISSFFFPRQKWLTKKIPNSWCDKVELIPLVLFAVLEHYVETEMHRVSWDWCETHKEAGEKINKIYKYIKEERPQLEKQLDQSYPRFVFDKLPILEELDFSEAHRIETLIEEKDSEAMIGIVELRNFLWS